MISSEQGGGGIAWGLYRQVMEHCDDLKISKAEFSRRTGISRPTIDRLATGTEVPHRTTVLRIAEALGWTEDDQVEKAYELAGYPPKVQEGVNARDAILRDPNLDEKGRQYMAQLYDYLTQIGQATQQAPAAPARPVVRRSTTRRPGAAGGSPRGQMAS